MCVIVSGIYGLIDGLRSDGNLLRETCCITANMYLESEVLIGYD